jgi:subtilisin family serine protease
MIRALALAGLVVAVAALGTVTRTPEGPTSTNGLRTEVVVSLTAPPLALPGSSAARIDGEQRAFRDVLATRLPQARVRWRYRLVANGFAVVLPRAQITDLEELPGVQEVFAPAHYGAQAVDRAADIGAPAIWGPELDSAGQGVKIGIIDTGIDQSHSYFDPTGYTMPSGFPKGQLKYTTSKVIVARAFPPPGATSRYAKAPFDPTSLSHGTHVAGIAAGNAATRATGGRIVSGVAPRAFIGNYKVFASTPSGLSPNANAPEIVAGIEAAVRDGMDVINLSLGESEIEPSRDIVAKALDAAAAAGVVPVVAAGNDYTDVGAGSVLSPGSSARAITVGALEGDAKKGFDHAYYSSVGPSPISLRLKPDVAAPGVAFSSVPGGWASLSGTSIAAPHVAGAAALLRERHPDWTVADIKAALVETSNDVLATGESAPAGPAFVGGGIVWLPAADRPLVFARPASVSWGLLSRGSDVKGDIDLRDAGGGAGSWDVSLEQLSAPSGTTVTVPATVEVPGTLSYDVATSATGAEGDVSGYVTLQRGGDVRRVPFWAHVEAPALGREPSRLLTRAGFHTGTTHGRKALVSRYRYPEDPRGVSVSRVLAGPEAVYRIRIARRVANFGVVITSRAPGSRVEPRVVAGLDENRLTGWAGLPVDENPYLDTFHTPVPASGALLPRFGMYAAVFDSRTAAGAGRFTFRLWVSDVTPPTLRLRTRTVAQGEPLVISATDSGAGVYPASIQASVDGRLASWTFRPGLIRVPTGALAVGRHTLRLRVSDYQESKNDENVARILPNTRTLTARFTVR